MLTPEDDEVFVQNERSTEVSTVTIPVPNEVIMEIDVPSTPAFAPTLNSTSQKRVRDEDEEDEGDIATEKELVNLPDAEEEPLMTPPAVPTLMSSVTAAEKEVVTPPRAEVEQLAPPSAPTLMSSVTSASAEKEPVVTNTEEEPPLEVLLSEVIIIVYFSQ